MLELQSVDFSFQQDQEKRVLSEVSLSVAPNQIVSVVGKSGCGKSTLFKLCTTELTPTRGTIRFQGREIQLGDVAYMPQQDLLLPWQTVLGNVMLPTKLDEANQLTEEHGRGWLEKAGLGDVADQLPHQLSGGMKQRAAFIRTLMTDSDVLLLDEPFGALDYFTQKEMQEWLLTLWMATNKTILVITHNIEEALYLSDVVYVMQPYRPGQSEQVTPIQIDLPRPREEAVRYSREFIAYKRQLEEAIYEKN